MVAGKQIIYFDESSTHLWEKLSKVWMSSSDPINLTLNKERGHSMTILGAISNRWTECKYTIAHKTTKETVTNWLDSYSNDFEFGAVLVLDNHAAHHSNLV
jgi:hypothetical protein